MISSLPGAMPGRPGSVSQPLPGVFPMVVDKGGAPVPPGKGGYLVITKPWPSMLRTIYGDDKRYNLQYWKLIPGAYSTGDGARCDAEGNYWILGRVDDVINVSGHRLSTMELENAVASHPAVAEAAVVGRPDERRGQAITVFVTLQSGFGSSDQLRQDLREHVVKAIGALARPDDVRFADALPKTRSGKIMRRLLRDIATGHEATGDITTLEDLHVLFQLRGDEERADR
jgi:acetyl-CoA synthetase